MSRARRNALVAFLTSSSLLVACNTQEDVATTTVAAPATSDISPSVSDTDGASRLADTSWQLIEFQSMDDSQGITRPANPAAYVLELHADGTVAMQLNCNRATGTWSAEPAADGNSGRFEFGRLATTGALCPPPSMDEAIARQAEYIRGYLLRDSNLYLSLMADGGIYAWAPRAKEIPFDTVPDRDIEAAIRDASPDYTQQSVDAGGGTQARYLYSRFDLNADGEDEVFVYPLGSVFCGTGGCNLQLYQRTGHGYSLVSEFPISRTPVIVAAAQSNGWRDIWRYRSGGGAPANYIAERFNGNQYVSAEVVDADEIPAGVRVLAGEFTFQQGIPLDPRK